MLGMNDVSDLTIEVLKGIRTDLAEVRDEIRAGLHTLTERVDAGFAAVNRRIDAVLEIAGTHHKELEARVIRIEDHLGLPR